ncbi:MAG: MFS transporter [Methylobacter sp.]|nr:MFS transporter [Methylobacter sp.]
MVHTESAVFAQQIFRKLDKRLLPLLISLYIVAYLDRVNIGFAKLTMTKELGFSDSVYGLGAGIFFLGYFLFEVPSNLILQRVGAKLWIARIMIVWGILSAATMFVTTPFQFYTVRFLLGLGEAGFTPGIILYLTYWYPAIRRAKATATFMSAIAWAGIIGGPLSGFIMTTFNGMANLAGWQWLFLLEALPAIILGLVVIIWMDNNPSTAQWLSSEERTWLVEQLLNETKKKQQSGHFDSFAKVFTNSKVWWLSGAYFSIVMGVYGITFWLPQIVNELDKQNIQQTGLLTAIPYLLAVVGMIVISHSSDKYQERCWHFALSAMLGSVGLILSGYYNDSLALTLLALSVSCLGTLSALPVFWSLPTQFLNGAAAAGGIALINSFGNLAGYLSPVLVAWLKEATGNLTNALYMMAAWLMLSAIIVILNFNSTRISFHSK